MQNLSRTALGTIAALVLGLAIGGGAGAIGFGGGGKKAAGEASLADVGVATVRPDDLPFFLTNRPGGGYDIAAKPGFQLKVTDTDTFHLVNLNPPPNPPAPSSDKLPPVPNPPQPEPPKPQPVESTPAVPRPVPPSVPDNPPQNGPITPPLRPIIPPKQSRAPAPPKCRKKPKSKQCRKQKK